LWAGRDAVDVSVDALESRELGELAGRLAGPEGLTERSNTFDERAVLQEFAQAAGQGARVAVVRARADRFGDRDDVLRTREGAMTTESLVDCERRLIDAAAGRAAAGCAVVPSAAIGRALAGADRPLTSEQERVVRGCARSGHGVDVVQALAGTGKTYTAGILRAVYERAGYRVLGLAPTGRGARELTDEAGIAACTIDRALIDIEQLGDALADRTVIVLDEAGMAPTRLTARLLGHATQAGAKVIAIGDSGQLPSVLAGGWLRAVGERVGALELTEVMRQRDPGERRALAALHDGLPHRYIEWATASGRIDVVRSDRIAEQAVGEWVAAAAGHAAGQAVMIARDNETRARLNELARGHRSDLSDLGVERFYGGTPIAVGDRVICRHNDAHVGVDNGTRGTVRHIDASRVVLETDSGAVRDLPASYVADHVEHAYCLTGHGMQGATVEQAVVVASPQDLTAGWSYSALSRATGATRLLIADTDRHHADRAGHAPDDAQPDQNRSAVMARAARRMLVRDDEDLALEQLPAAGHEDDRVLAAHRAAVIPVAQEAPAGRAEPNEPPPSLKRLSELREQISRLQLTLGALPTRPLKRIDDRDVRARDLAALRSDHQDQLAGLEPPARRFGRVRDPDAEARQLLQNAIEMDDRALADLAADRGRLQRELGDPDQVRSERESIENAIQQVRRDHDRLRDVLADGMIERQPEWLIGGLGQRPASARGSETWDRAARAIARFRLDHDVAGADRPFGAKPPATGEHRRDWDQASAALERAQRQLGLEHAARDRGMDLGIG
jgi:AAA domain